MKLVGIGKAISLHVSRHIQQEKKKKLTKAYALNTYYIQLMNKLGVS